jgi:undecaprenyl diphosphate synthase
MLPLSSPARSLTCSPSEETNSGTLALNLIMALSYSSRWELVNAVKNIAADVESG